MNTHDYQAITMCYRLSSGNITYVNGDTLYYRSFRYTLENTKEDLKFHVIPSQLIYIAFDMGVKNIQTIQFKEGKIV